MTLIQQRLERFLTAHPECKRIGIWGQGEVCNVVMSALSQASSQVSVVGITDSFYEGDTVTLPNGSRLMAAKKLLASEPDAIVIASIRFEEEIRLSISKLACTTAIKICSLTVRGSEFTNDAELNEQGVFLWPDSARSWRSLAENSESSVKKELYHRVAALLGNS